MEANFFENYLSFLEVDGLENASLERTGFSPCEPQELQVDEEEHIIPTACRACISNCGVLAHVKYGRVIKLEGNPTDRMSRGKLCAKGISGIAALYNPNRNKYPMQRVGERGEGKWKRISWDKAMDLIGNKLMQVRKDYGAESLFCTTGGGGNPAIWSISRFCNIFGSPNWYEPGCAQCYLPRVLAANMLYGGPDNSLADLKGKEFYDTDITPVKTIVLWGTDPSYSCAGNAGRMINELRSRGVNTVVIDPRFTPDAAKATVWLPIRPGTDVALMLAWIRYIIVNKLYDEDFCLRWTNLPYIVDPDTGFLLRAKDENGNPKTGRDGFMVWDRKTGSIKELTYPYDESLDVSLFGSFEADGKVYKTGAQKLLERVEEYTLEKAAAICDLDVDKIEKSIRIYTDNSPSGVCLGVATDQTPNSFQAAQACNLIDMLMGNMEKPGNSMQNFKTSNALHGANSAIPKAIKCLPAEQLPKRLGGVEHKGLGIWAAGHAPSTLDAILTGKPYQPRVWIDRSGNKLGVLAEPQKWVQAMDKIEMIVHLFVHPTSFSAYADIILPTTEWLETNMIVEVLNTLVARQAVVHTWDTRDERVIWSNIAKKCAELGHEMCQKAFDPEFMGEDLAYWETPEEFLNQMLRHDEISWEELKEMGTWEFATHDEWKTYQTYLQAGPDGIPKGFNTPSKKLEMYCDRLITLGRTGKPFLMHEVPPASKDYDPLPYYLEPSESPMNNDGIADEYPLVMTNGRVPYYHHSTLRNVPGLREMYPVPEIWINTRKAAELGIAPNDWVWVESLRGKVRARAYCTEGIAPGTVCMERYWFPENLYTDTHGWKEANVNVLSKGSAPYNDVVGTYTLRAYMVKVYKAETAPEGIWEKPEEFRKWLPV